MFHCDYFESLRPTPNMRTELLSTTPEPTQDFQHDLNFKAPCKDGAKALRSW